MNKQEVFREIISEWLGSLPSKEEVHEYVTRLDDDSFKTVSSISEELVRLLSRRTNDVAGMYDVLFNFLLQIELRQYITAASLLCGQILRASDVQAEYTKLGNALQLLLSYDEEKIEKGEKVVGEPLENVKKALEDLEFIPVLERDEFLSAPLSERIEFFNSARVAMHAIGKWLLKNQAPYSATPAQILTPHLAEMVEIQLGVLSKVAAYEPTVDAEYLQRFDWAINLVREERLLDGASLRIYNDTLQSFIAKNDKERAANFSLMVQRALLQSSDTFLFFQAEGDVVLMSDAALENKELVNTLLTEKWKSMGFDQRAITIGLAAVQLYQKTFQDSLALTE